MRWCYLYSIGCDTTANNRYSTAETVNSNITQNNTYLSFCKTLTYWNDLIWLHKYGTATMATGKLWRIIHLIDTAIQEAWRYWINLQQLNIGRANVWKEHHKWASSRATKPVFGVSEKVKFKPAYSAMYREQLENWNFNGTVASRYMIFSTKALIRLRECAGWSAPLLFSNHQRQVFLRRGSNGLHNYVMTMR